DVFQAGNTWLPELVALGALEPLDERLARWPTLDRGDYFPGILDTNVIEGATYAVPWYVDTRLLFYRSDVLADAGSPEPPRTWTAWTDAMMRVKERVGPERYAILLPLREWQPPVILALQRGASLAVSRGSGRKDAAWKLVEFLSEPAQQVRFYRLTGDLPARKAAWADEGLPRDRRARAFWIQLQSVQSTPKIPEWERIAAKVSQYSEAAIRGNLTIDQALAGLDRDVDNVLEKRRWLMRAAGR